MISCVFGLTACGGSNNNLTYDQSIVEAYCQNAIGLIMQDYPEESLAEIRSYDKYTWDEIESSWRQYGLTVEGKVIVDGIDSFINAKEDMGTATEMKGITISSDHDTITAIVSMSGSIRDAEIEILFDKYLHVTNITTNVVYSFGEQMGKAGLNTLMGMGTVFVVLILISIIISCFGFIPKIQEKAKAKKEAKNSNVSAMDNTIAQIIEKEEQSDDTELVAVIAAAIAASEGATSTDGFVVRSIRRR